MDGLIPKLGITAQVTYPGENDVSIFGTFLSCSHKIATRTQTHSNTLTHTHTHRLQTGGGSWLPLEGSSRSLPSIIGVVFPLQLEKEGGRERKRERERGRERKRKRGREMMFSVLAIS